MMSGKVWGAWLGVDSVLTTVTPENNTMKVGESKAVGAYIVLACKIKHDDNLKVGGSSVDLCRIIDVELHHHTPTLHTNPALVPCVMRRGKQGDCSCYLFSSHDGRREDDLSSFGSVACAGLWLWLVVSMQIDYYVPIKNEKGLI